MFDKNKDWGVDDAVVAEGELIASLLVNAQVSKGMGGLGGCKEFDLSDYPARFHKLVVAYLNHEISSVTVFYIAMRNLDAELQEFKVTP